MGQPDSTLIEAIETAMEAEQKACQFYRDSVAKASSPRGKDLLNQLAGFEQNHFDKLKELRDSLGAGAGFVAYEGTEFQPVTSGPESGSQVEVNVNDVLDILRLAIEAETGAHKRYLKLAEQTDDPRGKELFLRFAAEETKHRRILSDEHYHLSNRDGVWMWGE